MRSRPDTGGLLKRTRAALTIIVGMTVVAASPGHAYIGPGAGMVFLSSFLAILLAFLMALVLIVLGAFRWLFGLFRRQRRRAGARARRVVIIGFDGASPHILEPLMAAGKLPNFAALAEEGAYRPLRTTCPPISPVAWSTFATGANPGKHNIFDFLSRNPHTYQPELSSTKIRMRTRRVGLGPLGVERACPTVQLEQKGRAFWEVLGEHGIFSAVMRVPITYPPPRFHGVALAGMCAPDLLGTQGTFAYYTTEPDEIAAYEGGMASLLNRANGRLHGQIDGPENPRSGESGPLTVPFELSNVGDGRATLHLQGERVELRVGEYTDWVPVRFRVGPLRSIRGITRFRLLEAGERVRLYQMPLNIDPATPTMPIASPLIFASYLQKAHGDFATLGLAEDTWALNEGILDDAAFIEQCYLFHHERRKLLFDMLDKVRDGAVVFVFDITDRLQHMFLGRNGAAQGPEAIPSVVEQVYRDMDELLGLIRARLSEDDVLLVMSDHGFSTFTRCVDLNRWLLEEGYLAVGEDGAIDWSRTRAYAMGLAGIYLNVAGRETQGTVPSAEVAALKSEVAEKLAAMVDPETGEKPVQGVFDPSRIYTGPYAQEAPDLIVGYAPGYRVSWDSVVGKVGPTAFCANPKPWSADHCLHPAAVPGILLCNRALEADDAWIGDLAPTVLELLGVEKPALMDGRSLGVLSADVSEGTRKSERDMGFVS